MGWDETEFTLQQAVDTCTDLSGEIEACPLFTVISEAEQKECSMKLPTAIAKEDVSGPVASIPGDVTIAWGPEPAGSEQSGDATTTPVTTMATLSYSAGSTATNNGSVVPGNIFQITPTTTISEYVTPTISAGESMVTLATSTFTYTGASGDVTISEIVYEQQITWVTQYTTTTMTVEPTAAAARRDMHAHQHRHAHGHKH